MTKDVSIAKTPFLQCVKVNVEKGKKNLLTVGFPKISRLK